MKTDTRQIEDYDDFEVFKPGELWKSPRGITWLVLSNAVCGKATLRRVPGGAKNHRPWDDCINWVRVSAAPEQ